MAESIAAVVGATQDRRDWFEGNGLMVTWCKGHLLELYVPEADGAWELKKLPVLPQKFHIRPISKGKDKSGKAIPDYSILKRIEAIKNCFSKCDTIICATDAGREGQLIFQETYDYIGIRKPVMRLWISSKTEEAIRKGMANLMSNDDPQFVNLYKAARARNEADWLVGINATRALTLASGLRHHILTAGRVQTPTLAMVCKRYIEHQLFKPEPFWYIEGASTVDGVSFKWRGEERYDKSAEGTTDKNAVEAEGFLTVKEVETHRNQEEPPLLHDLTSLQQIANTRYGYTADEVMDAAQSLYDKKYLSYPRTGSRYIPEDVFNTIPDLLKRLITYPEYGDSAYKLIGEKLNRRSVNETKITDHHALLVTEVIPKDLEGIEKDIYELVLLRLIEAFSPVCVVDVTNVTFESADTVFKTRGRKVIAPGWKSVNKGAEEMEDTVDLQDIDEIELSMRPLPVMKEGDRIPIQSIALIEDKTKPKPLLTDATLLASMKSAGRGNDDRKVVAALRDIGIGTVATRDEIIKGLIVRGYITRVKRKFIPTELGLNLYRAVRGLDLADVELTAHWEMALEDIANGDSEESVFGARIRSYTTELIEQLVSEQCIQRVAEKMKDLEPKCPRCGEGIRIGEKSAWCPDCKFTLWRNIAGKQLSEQTVRTLLQKGSTGKLKGFVNKKGQEFEAALKMDKDGQLSFDFRDR